jgi:hypothetical protein
MNNYLALNLVNGKLSRVAGGGRPKFVLDEQNEVQLYVLDFPKPSTYPPSSLSDAYAYEISPRDFTGSSVTLKAGVRGGSSIVSTNSFFNLPTDIGQSASASIDNNVYFSGGDVRALTTNLFFSLSSIPSVGSLFSFTITINSHASVTYVTPAFSFDSSLSSIQSILTNAIFGAIIASNPSATPLGTSQASELPASEIWTNSLIQVSDYSYSYYSTILIDLSVPFTYSISVTFNNVSASSNPGKYGYLDFSSSSWDSVIGTNVEAPIWMEAMIGSDTIAQGNAIICRKMT